MDLKMKRAAFFDRDGTLNLPTIRDGRAYAPLSEADFRIYPEAKEALTLVNEAGLVNLVVTNQPELATGDLNPESLKAMHKTLRDALPIEAVYVCPHHSSEGCECHKPGPKLLLQAAEEWDLDLGSSFLVGDRWRDILAGDNVGCTTILIDRPYSGDCNPHYRVPDLKSAADCILQNLA